jgi:hypothetical protein
MGTKSQLANRRSVLSHCRLGNQAHAVRTPRAGVNKHGSLSSNTVSTETKHGFHSNKTTMVPIQANVVAKRGFSLKQTRFPFKQTFSEEPVADSACRGNSARLVAWPIEIQRWSKGAVEEKNHRVKRARNSRRRLTMCMFMFTCNSKTTRCLVNYITYE